MPEKAIPINGYIKTIKTVSLNYLAKEKYQRRIKEIREQLNISQDGDLTDDKRLFEKYSHQQNWDTKTQVKYENKIKALAKEIVSEILIANPALNIRIFKQQLAEIVKDYILRGKLNIFALDFKGSAVCGVHINTESGSEDLRIDLITGTAHNPETISDLYPLSFHFIPGTSQREIIRYITSNWEKIQGLHKKINYDLNAVSPSIRTRTKREIYDFIYENRDKSNDEISNLLVEKFGYSSVKRYLGYDNLNVIKAREVSRRN